ncbi:MAG: hypothetical protein P8018_10045 [Acidobacteriota bacterium]|jgi:hypothetical protein
MKVLGSYAFAWFGLAVVAVLNGILRVESYGRFMGELAAHQISTLVAILVLGALIWFLTGWVRIQSPAQAVAIGLMWLVMTVLFEFGFGHFAAGHSWSKLLADYNLLKGRLWPLLLVWIAAAPSVFVRLRR